jgi:hypothetical protein
MSRPHCVGPNNSSGERQNQTKYEKTSIYAAALALEKDAPDAAAEYKAVLDYKACHTVHKPD